jgi:hypothetical protein
MQNSGTKLCCISCKDGGNELLQNCMALVKGEPGSCSERACGDETEESTKAEEAIDIKEENNGEAKSLPVMETEHLVRLHMCVCVYVYMCVCVCVSVCGS